MENKEEEKIIKKIEEFFRVPASVADKVKNVAEKDKIVYINKQKYTIIKDSILKTLEIDKYRLLW